MTSRSHIALMDPHEVRKSFSRAALSSSGRNPELASDLLRLRDDVLADDLIADLHMLRRVLAHPDERVADAGRNLLASHVDRGQVPELLERAKSEGVFEVAASLYTLRPDLREEVTHSRTPQKTPGHERGPPHDHQPPLLEGDELGKVAGGYQFEVLRRLTRAIDQGDLQGARDALREGRSEIAGKWRDLPYQDIRNVLHHPDQDVSRAAYAAFNEAVTEDNAPKFLMAIKEAGDGHVAQFLVNHRPELREIVREARIPPPESRPRLGRYESRGEARRGSVRR